MSIMDTDPSEQDTQNDQNFTDDPTNQDIENDLNVENINWDLLEELKKYDRIMIMGEAHSYPYEWMDKVMSLYDTSGSMRKSLENRWDFTVDQQLPFMSDRSGSLPVPGLSLESTGDMIRFAELIQRQTLRNQSVDGISWLWPSHAELVQANLEYLLNLFTGKDEPEKIDPMYEMITPYQTLDQVSQSDADKLVADVQEAVESYMDQGRLFEDHPPVYEFKFQKRKTPYTNRKIKDIK